jgi:beta-glucosidase
MEEVGRAVGAEMADYGTTFWLAPGMNIHRNPLCGRNYEYFGEDPVHTGRAAAALVTGVQSTGGVYATLKHFCCNNQEAARRTVSANVGERALREIYLRGFGIAVTAGKPGGVMTAYNRINGVYAANSYEINTMVLRNEWGFDGIVMTDWGAAAPGAADPVLAMSAGNDLLMPGHRLDRQALRTALKRGTLKEDDLRRCASNIVRGILNSRRAREARP